MGTYSSVRAKDTSLLRKAKDGSVFIAPISADPITTLTTGATPTLTALPTGYVDLGWMTSDGISFARETEVSEVTSFGSVEPTRTDTTSDTISVSFTCQETNLETIGLYTGADIAGITANATTGEVQIAKPARPASRFYRILVLAVDDADGGEVYFGRFIPRARITEIGEQTYTNGDDPITVSVTAVGVEDATLGYSHKFLYGGPGFKGLLTAAGIPLAS